MKIFTRLKFTYTCTLGNLQMTSNKCRVCMQGETFIQIFQENIPSEIADLIMSIANVTLSPNDGLPNKMCTECLRNLHSCIEFKNLCEETDMKLRSMINETDEEDLKEEIDFENIDGEKSVNVIINDVNLNGQSENHSNLSERKSIENLQNSKQKQQCFTCGKIMSSKFRLKTHLRTHTGERPYSCPHCNKNFTLEQNLKVHLRVHTGEKPLQCTICGASFAQSAGLAAHRRKHTGQLPYACVLCPRSFRTVGHLQYHVRRHTGEKNFECDTCSKAFITRSDLKQHLSTHTGERPHVCNVCGARMSRAWHLKRHLQQAHNTIHSCTTCGVQFTLKIEFEQHLKTHSNSE